MSGSNEFNNSYDQIGEVLTELANKGLDFEFCDFLEVEFKKALLESNFDFAQRFMENLLSFKSVYDHITDSDWHQFADDFASSAVGRIPDIHNYATQERIH